MVKVGEAEKNPAIRLGTIPDICKHLKRILISKLHCVLSLNKHVILSLIMMVLLMASIPSRLK